MADSQIVSAEHLLVSAASIVEILRRNYSVGKQFKCVLEKSAPNAVYRISTDKGVFALKLFNAIGSFEFEREFVYFLQINGVNVANFISTDSGTPFFSMTCCNLQFYGVLYQYIPGRDPILDVSEEAFMYGQELSRLHAASKEFDPSIEPPAFDPIDRLDKSVRCISSVLTNLEQYEVLYQSA